MNDSVPSGDDINNTPVKSLWPRRRFVLTVLVLAGLICLAVAVVANLRKKHPTVNITYSGQQIQLRLVDTLYGKHSTFKMDPSSSVLDKLKEKLPQDLAQFLERSGWMKAGSTVRGFETKIDKPDSLRLVFRAGLKNHLTPQDNTTGTKARIKKTSTLLAGHAFENMRVVLASPDHRYMDSARLEFDGSRLSPARSGTGDQPHPYASAHFLSVPRNIPEFEMTVYITPKWGSATSSTLNLTNPLYQTPKAPQAPQALPARQTKDGVTFVLMKVIGDVGNNLMARDSVAGINAWKLLKEGKYLRANMEEGEYGTTLIQARIIEGNSVSKNWKMANVKFFDTNGNRVGNGFGATQYQGEPEWYQESVNIASVGETAILKATLARSGGFPADELANVDVPLPRADETLALDQTVKTWIGELHLDSIVNYDHSHNNGYEALQINATGPVGGEYHLQKITLSSTTTTLDLPLDMQGASWGPTDTQASYNFRAHINWPHLTGLNTDDYSTVTLEFIAPRKLEFEFVVKPDLAKVPAEPVDAWNAFEGQ